MNTIEDIMRDYVTTALNAVEYDEVSVEIVKAINRTYDPEEVFDEQTLSNWAEENGYKKVDGF